MIGSHRTLWSSPAIFTRIGLRIEVGLADPKSPTVGTRVRRHIHHIGWRWADMTPAVQAYLPENPHVKFYNSQRGYVCLQRYPERWQSDYRVVPFVEKPGAGISTRATFVVESGAAAQRL